MANLYRLVLAACLYLVIALLASQAHAYPGKSIQPGVPEYKGADYSGVLGRPVPGWRLKASDACNDSCAVFNYVKGLDHYPTNATCSAVGLTCFRTYFGERDGGLPIASRVGPPSEACPANSAQTPASGALCQCNTSYVDGADKLSCDLSPDACPATGAVGAPMVVKTTPANILSKQYVCVPAKTGTGGCLFEVNPTTAYPSRVPGSTEFYSSGPSTSKGPGCTFDAAGVPSGTGTQTDPRKGAGAASDVDPACPPPKQKGQVNGVDVCLPPRPGDPVVTTNTTTTAPPTTAASAATAPVTTSTSTTNCAAGACTTTTNTATTTNGVTGEPTTETKTESRDDYCTKNPRAPACQDSSYGGGTCGSAAPACSGDAVQCGIALQSWQTACALNPGASPEKTAYTDAMASLNSGSVLHTLPGKTTVDMQGMIDQTAHLAGSQGQVDLELTIAGRPFTFELSRLNYWLDVLGNIAVAMSLIAAVGIVFGGKS